jgi:hypothetical protein
MYAAPGNEGGALGGARIGEKEMEDYLLGKRRVDEVLAQGDKNVSPCDPSVFHEYTDRGFKVGNMHKDFIALQNANSARDTAAKIREDPLLAIKKREQAENIAYANRPDVRKQLKAMRAKSEVGGESKEERKARRKEEKMEKREKKAIKRERRERDSDERRSTESDDGRGYRKRSRSRSPQRERRDEGRYRDDSPRRSGYERYSRDSHGRNERDERDRRDDRERSRSHRERESDYGRSDRHSRDADRSQREDDRIPPPRHYPTHNTHPSRPSAMDLADAPTTSRAPPPPPKPSQSILDEQRAARLAAMSSTADQLYAERSKTLAQRAEEQKRDEEKDMALRKKFGKETVSAGFYNQSGVADLGEALGRRGGKGLQRDI